MCTVLLYGRLTLLCALYFIAAVICCLMHTGEYTMLAHHSVTGILAYFSLYPYIQYQCFFFSGIVELSNIPLTIMDVFKVSECIVSDLFVADCEWD